MHDGQELSAATGFRRVPELRQGIPGQFAPQLERGPSRRRWAIAH